MALSTPSRRRLSAVALVTGLVASTSLALSFGVSMSSLTASINNSTNTAASAALAITETSGALTCNSYDATATCSTINKYGGTASPIAPGGSQTTTVTFTNPGSIAVGSSTLAPGTCTATTSGGAGSTTPTTPNTTSGNLCSVLNIAVYSAATATGPTIYNGSASGFTATIALGTLAKAASQSYTFVVSLPSSATTAVQGQQVSQPLLWTFNQ